MNRRVAVEIAVLVLLAATVVVLWLNHGEIDEYPPSSTVDTLGDLPSWLRATQPYSCEACKERVRRFVPSECRISVTITDRDGWYRLFWAGAETYTYDDAALVGGALRNSTAVLSGGTWTIRGRYVPVEQHPPHVCPGLTGEFELRYRLERGRIPDSIDPVIDSSGALAAPRRFLWFRYPFPPDRVDDFWWELEMPADEQKQERGQER